MRWLPPVDVIRLGHRVDRDRRMTSHLGLTARALGANGMIIFGDRDPSIVETLSGVSERFGGKFTSRFEKNPMGYLKKFRMGGPNRLPGTVVHLTMYGESHTETLPRIRRDRPIAFVVGGAKVPGELFGIADYNISVGNQPHSEVAALAITLSEWFKSVALESSFSDPIIKVIPSKSGKSIIDKSKDNS